MRNAIAAAGAAALALLLLGSSSALAATGHPVLDTFTTGFGSNVRSVATDSADNIYVARAGSGRVSKYDSSGNPVSFTGSAPYIEGNSLTGGPPLPKGGIFKPNLHAGHRRRPFRGCDRRIHLRRLQLRQPIRRTA